MAHASPMHEVRNFIAGEYREASDGAWIECKHRQSDEDSTRLPDSDVLDLVQSVQAANKALPAWLRQEPAARGGFLKSIAQAILERSDEVARIQSIESGVSLLCSADSVRRTADAFDYYSRVIESENGRLSGVTQLHPIGVVAIITPAYEPVYALGSRAAAALAAGNVVIAKPSSAAPRSVNALTECFRAAGLPSGIFNLVQGRGEKIGHAMVEHPGLSVISFAGRTSTGRSIQIAASENLKRTQLSMSGCNPALVFKGCDLDKTALDVARLSLGSDMSPHLRAARIFVQDAVYKPFLEALKVAARKVEVNPLARDRDRESFFQAVAQALKERGKLLVGDANPAKIQATVIYDVSLCSTLQQEEILGPLAMVESFKYQHDAVKHANNSPFGLAAYVFHPEPETAASIARKIEAARVFTNTSRLDLKPEQEFGGLKMSGQGREGGLEILRFFSRESSIFC